MPIHTRIHQVSNFLRMYWKHSDPLLGPVVVIHMDHWICSIHTYVSAYIHARCLLWVMTVALLASIHTGTTYTYLPIGVHTIVQYRYKCADTLFSVHTYVCTYVCKWRDIIPIITGIALFVVRIRCLGFVTDPGHYFIIFGVMISRYSVMSGGELTTGRRGGPKFALKFASSSPWNADSNCEKKNKVTATNFQRNIQPFLW